MDKPPDWREALFAVLSVLPVLAFFTIIPWAYPILVIYLLWIAPTLLAWVVLRNVLKHVSRLYTQATEPKTQYRPGDTAVSSILFSVVLGTLALSILMIVSVRFVAEMLQFNVVVAHYIPYIFLVGIFGVLVLLKAVFFAIFPRGPTARIQQLRPE